MKDKFGSILSTEQVVKKSMNRAGSIVLEFTLFLLHIVGCIPSHTIRRLAYTLAGMQIGKGSSIHMGATFYDLGKISIGNDTIIGERVVLDGRDTIKIGNHVAIASEVMIYNSEHDINDEHFTPISEPVVIEDYVFIGPRAIILPGVTIHQGAVVGAGAVVTKDVDEFTVVGGVPAKVIKERSLTNPQYTLG